MVLQHLYSLGLVFMLTANPTPYCGRQMNGCFLYETKQIIININTDNFRRTVYHEIGHALTYNDSEFAKLCKESKFWNNYRKLPGGIYELMADMYMKYQTHIKYLDYHSPAIKNYISKNYL